MRLTFTYSIIKLVPMVMVFLAANFVPRVGFLFTVSLKENKAFQVNVIGLLGAKLLKLKYVISLTVREMVSPKESQLFNI